MKKNKTKGFCLKKESLPGFAERLYLLLNQFNFMRFTKGILAGFLLLAGIRSSAQFNKGEKMVGASVASIFFNSGNSDISVASIGNNISKITSYGVNITPSIGWFISEKTAIGATLNINPNGQKTTYEQSGSTYQSDQSNGFNIGVGGFARNYFSRNNTLLPFGQFSLNAGISNLKTEGFFYGGAGPTAYKLSYSGNSSGGFFANANFSAGFTKMMGENAGLDFYIGYNYSYNKNTFKRTSLRDIGNDGTIDERGENETTTKFTNHGFVLGLGFQIFLKGKTK
jgi:hypothetical protein